MMTDVPALGVWSLWKLFGCLVLLIKYNSYNRKASFKGDTYN